MNPADVLQPNYMGDSLRNTGVEELVRNHGIGVREAMSNNSQAMAQDDSAASPGAAKDNMRTAKAREFGLTKQTVGF